MYKRSLALKEVWYNTQNYKTGTQGEGEAQAQVEAESEASTVVWETEEFKLSIEYSEQLLHSSLYPQAVVTDLLQIWLEIKLEPPDNRDTQRTFL